MHTAGEGRLNLPQVRKLAKASGAAVLVDQAGCQGTLRRAATDAGVPTLLFEAGEPGRFDPKVLLAGLKCILNLLFRMKMRPASPRQNIPFSPSFQVVARRRTWIRSRHGGMLDLKVRPGDIVYQDDVVAAVLNPFGRLRKKLRSNLTGIVIGTTVQPLAAPGTGVAHVAELRSNLGRVEKSMLQYRKLFRKAE